jgi:polyisoprenyl-phosphate glycosyltransferase
VPELHSIVVPVFNEEAVLPAFFERLRAALEPVGDWEVVFVDDGSTDDTYAILKSLAASDGRVRLIRFGRNFGQQVAIAAGIDAADGDTVTVIDADLQDPPELIPQMIERWRAGADVVYAIHQSREGELWIKKATATVFYRVLRLLTPIDIPVDHSEFRLMSSRAAAGLRAMREQSRYTRGLVAWLGLPSDTVRYHRDARAAGETKYSLFTLTRLAVDSIVSFSARPLQLASAMGFVAAFAGFVYGIYALYMKLVVHYPVAGWTSLMIVLLFFSGVQLITVGIIGEYIARIYSQVLDRPLYTVTEMVGFAEPVERRAQESCVMPERDRS